MTQSNLDLEAVVSALKSGQTIVYPTETCYGLGCDARNSAAVEKVIKIKQRRESKPLLVVVPDAAMAMEYLEWSPRLEEIASKYWPGALTVVVEALSLRGGAEATTKQSVLFRRLLDCFVARAPRNDSLASGVVAKDGTIALRVIAHPVAAALAQALGRPLISTSANISGKAPSYSAEEVIKMFENQPDQPDIIIDAGELPHRAPSTIIRVLDGNVEVLRQGEIVVGK